MSPPPVVVRVFFHEADLEGIRAGRITLAFRAWDRPRVKAGTKLRTAIGLVEVVDVAPAGELTDADARAAGRASVAELRAYATEGKTLYRIALRFAGDDPRVELRDSLDGLEALAPKIARDAKALAILRLIGAHEGVVSTELAAKMGRERLAFKADVRKLKELGLTESLEIGYRLSPRGKALLERIERGGQFF